MNENYLNNEKLLKRKNIEIILVSIVSVAILLTSLLISKRPYIGYLLFNCIYSIGLVIYLVYSLRVIRYELVQKRKLFTLMINSNVSEEYLIYKDKKENQILNGVRVNVLTFISKNDEERTINCLIENKYDLNKDQEYIIQTANNVLIGVKQKNEK